MAVSKINLLTKLHESHRVVIDKFNLSGSKLMQEIDCIKSTRIISGVSNDTKDITIKLFFDILDILPPENIEILRVSGVGFLLEDIELWGRLEYIIYAADPKKSSSLIKAFTNIINFSHGIYQTSEMITTTARLGNEYKLKLYSESIVSLSLFDTQVFLELRVITSSFHKIHGKTGQTTLRNSLKGFFEILEILSSEQIAQLKKSGLRSLINNKEFWINLEFSIYSNREVEAASLLTKQLQNLINYSNSVYEQSEQVTTTKHKGIDTPLIRNAYRVSVELFNALVDWKVKELNEGAKINSLRHALIGIINSIRYIEDSDKYKDEFSDIGLSIFNKNIYLSEELNENIPQLNYIVMIDVLSRLGVEYPNYRLQIKSKKTEVFLKNTYKQSLVIFNELSTFANNYEFEKSKTTANKYFSDFDSIGLPLLKKALSDDAYKALCESGLSSLDNEDTYDKINDYARKMKISSSKMLGLSLLKKIFKKDITFIKDSPYTLYFSGISRNNEIKPFNMDVLGELSEQVFEEFKIKHEEYIKKIDLEDISEISYHSQLQDLVAGLKKVIPKLSSDQIKAIQDNGLSAFVDGKYKISITFLQKFQALVKSKKSNSRTIVGYRNAFRNIFGKFVGEVPDVYVISTKKDDLIKSLSFDSEAHYTTDEIRELAFYIEKGLMMDDTSLVDKIFLYYARIQIKTGWNQQPLIDLLLDRLTKRTNPISNKENYDLVLVKNRRGYEPSRYDFDENAIKDRDLKSVIRDIIFVRDNLTSELRIANYLDNYLFIEPCEVNGAKRIDVSRLSRLPRLISNLGCKVHYNPRKIRKGGVNFIYKKIAKSVKHYEGLAAHNVQTFLKSYKEISKVECVDKLSDGIDIMANYFSGKEIHQELHAIDDINEIDNAQETPTGVCSSTPDSDEVKRYNKLNVKTIDKDNKFCGDFLACIWCKYFKVVKDADHLWKLLSYKEYVISTMERAIVDNEDPEEQRGFIDILSKRVDDIVFFIEETKPTVVAKARSLFNSKGVHPDWEFAFPLSDVVGGEV